MTTFQARHFQAVAIAMQKTKPEDFVALTQWEVTRDALADVFALGNGKFDRDRFVHACEPGANVRARS
jgi:hypothetical protein